MKTQVEIMNEFTRLEAACRRFKFETIKSLGIFWLIEKIPWLKIKEPWNKLYKRSLRKKYQKQMTKV